MAAADHLFNALAERAVSLPDTDAAVDRIAARARARYACFEYFGDNPQGYGLAVTRAQLARERYGGSAFSIRFSTYEGTVTAASDWDAPMERKRCVPAFLKAMSRCSTTAAWTGSGSISPIRDAARVLAGPRIQRAIGVIYRPETERWSHYFEARLPDQFDVLIHLDRTAALAALDRSAGWDEGEPPETWPTAL